MKRAKLMKRDMLIYKLSKDGDNYPDIAQRLVARGYDELNPDHIGRIARRMKWEIEGK